MATTPLGDGFDSAAFRTAIQQVFTMGMAPNLADQVKFYFAPVLVYDTGAVDKTGIPFDPNTTVTRTQLPPVSVPCGVEYKDNKGQATVFGDTVPATIEITLLDEDFAKVDGCSYIVAKGEKYQLVNVEPPSGLFDVGIYTLNFAAENAS